MRPSESSDPTLDRLRENLRRELRAALHRKGITMTALARRMGAGRSTLARALSQDASFAQLRTLARLAVALGSTLVIEFEPATRMGQRDATRSRLAKRRERFRSKRH